MVRLQPGHKVLLLTGGQALFPELIGAIDAAHTEVRLETYIFHDDPAAALVFQALERAARRGVAVYLVIDGVGTPELAPEWGRRCSAAGIRWAVFSPTGPWGWLQPMRWRRMHSKLCVVDGALGFCGGINLMDDYFELLHGWQAQPRLDFAVQVEGPLVARMQAAMEQFWRRLMGSRALANGNLWGLGQSWLPQRRHSAAGLRQPASGVAAAAANGGVLAAFLLRDNLRHRREIERAYRQALARARDEIVIANAYFLPGARLYRALLHAARRGVRVRLLLQGRYEFFMQFHAAKAFYGALLEAGVEIYEYQTAYLHAKVAVVDGHWMTVGSSNLDPLSLLLAREANVVLEDARLAQSLRHQLLESMRQHSERVLPERLRQRSWLARMRIGLAYGLMRLGLYLSGKKY